MTKTAYQPLSALRMEVAGRQLANLEEMDRTFWERSAESGKSFGEGVDWLRPNVLYRLQDMASGRSR